jgi:peptide/nickel transport system ATP-binding protein
MTAPLLELDSFSVSIGGRPIVQELSLTVGAGEILGLVGASGSGKSLTALGIMRLLPRTALASGSIRLGGLALDSLSEQQMQRIRGRQVGMVFQEPMTALNPLMRIGAQVAETVSLHGAASGAAAAKQARTALEAVGLTGERGSPRNYPHELSGGQRQRVAIALATVLEPALLIADEPTTALDVRTQAGVLAQLVTLVRERGMGMILVSHDLALISQVTDRVAIMQAGRIVEQGATATALKHLSHPYSRALLEAATLAPRRVRTSIAGPAAADSTPVLEARGLVRDYALGRRSLWRAPPAFRAVDHVSLEVQPGESVGLIGESGSGKSTLLRLLLALDRPQAGEVRLLGEAFSAARGKVGRRLRRSIQAVFQDPYSSFDPEWPVERLVAEPLRLAEVQPTKAEMRRRVASVLEQVGLRAADGARYSHEFSGGQRQRIAIARALITAPTVIVFDEAVTALDVLVRAQIIDLLIDLNSRLKMAYLFISHDIAVVRAIADRVYVMQQGRIVEHGAAATVLESPQHDYTRALLGATPRIQA